MRFTLHNKESFIIILPSSQNIRDNFNSETNESIKYIRLNIEIEIFWILHPSSTENNIRNL